MPVALGLFQLELAFDIGELFLLRLGDDRDLAVAAFSFERQVFLNFGRFAFLRFFDNRHFALGA